MPPPVLTAELHQPAQPARQPRTKPMPLVTAAISIPVLAMILSTASAAIVIEQPTTADTYPILGAILASVVVLMEARYKNRPFLPSVAGFIGSSAAGSFIPAPAYYVLTQMGWISPEEHLWTRAWQTWAAAGFICGLNGWFLIHQASSYLKSFGGRLTKTSR
jgi:hypothetical protein